MDVKWTLKYGTCSPSVILPYVSEMIQHMATFTV